MKNQDRRKPFWLSPSLKKSRFGFEFTCLYQLSEMQVANKSQELQVAARAQQLLSSSRQPEYLTRFDAPSRLFALCLGLLCVGISICAGAQSLSIGIPGREAAIQIINLYSGWRQATTKISKQRLAEEILSFEQKFASSPPGVLSTSEIGEIQIALGHVYLDRHDGVRARNLDKAISYAQAARAILQPVTQPRHYLQASRLLGSALMEEKQWAKAYRAFGDAFNVFASEADAQFDDDALRLLMSDAGSLFSDGAFTAMQTGDTYTAFRYIEEGRAKYAAVKLVMNTLGQNSEKIFQLRKAIEKVQISLKVGDETEKMVAEKGLLALRKQLHAAVVEEHLEMGDTRAHPRRWALASIPKDGAIVVPVITRVGTKLIIVAGDKNGNFITAADLPSLTTHSLSQLLADDNQNGWLDVYRVHQFREDRSKNWHRWMSTLDGIGHRLWKYIGAEMNNALAKRGVTAGARVIVLATGPLGILPLGLAHDPASGVRLVERYELTFAASFFQMIKGDRVDHDGKDVSLAAVVNPTNNLPNADIEGKVVASYFSADRSVVLPGALATRDSVVKALKNHTHWHFATHGTFNWKNPRESALLMHQEDPLTVGRIASEIGLGRPRLVVLSACETGLYDIRHNSDEMVGLPSAFLALGASGVIGTLWPVDDGASALLMARFYELYAGNKMRPSAALHAAQAWLRQSTDTELRTFANNVLIARLPETQRAAEIIDALVPSKNLTADTADRINVSPHQLASDRPFAHPHYWAGFTYTGR